MTRRFAPTPAYSTGWTLTEEGTIEPEVRAYVEGNRFEELNEDLKEVLNPIIEHYKAPYNIFSAGQCWQLKDEFLYS